MEDKVQLRALQPVKHLHERGNVGNTDRDLLGRASSLHPATCVHNRRAPGELCQLGHRLSPYLVERDVAAVRVRLGEHPLEELPPCRHRYFNRTFVEAPISKAAVHGWK
jgi:hypothetical protein